jgi:acetyltransferase-like isoleucine patch superfamily enzyme
VIAVCLPRDTPLAPFAEPAAALPVLGGTLAEAQAAALAAAGLTPGPDDPAAPRLVYGGNTWFTATLLRRLLALGRPGRLVVRDTAWLSHVTPLAQDPAHPTIGVVPAGMPASALLALDELEVEAGVEPMPAALDNPAFAHAQAGLVSGLAVAHDVEHWAHVVRLNGIALAALGRERKAEYDGLPGWRKVGFALGVLRRAGKLREAEVLRALSRVGARARIHPTAVVEACELGDDVEVGPGAVLRGVVAGNGAKIEPMAHVVASSVGPKATVGRQTHLALCVVGAGAYVSAGVGHQATIFGRESFTALGVCTFDLSFGQHVAVETPEGRRSAGTFFLGSAIGHRARIGAGVRLGYGVAVPNDAFLVAPAADVLRRWPEPVEGPATIENGIAIPVKRSPR